MNPERPFSTVEEQISTLKMKGLDIRSLTYARKILRNHSYFSLINGYREPFLFKPRSGSFIPGSTLKEVYALYFFDKRLRDGLFPYLLEAEGLLKHRIVYQYLEARGSNGEYLYPKDAYLSLSGYDGTQKKNALKCIIGFHKKISEQLDQHGSVAHYLSTYSFVPLWVLKTKLTFGELWHFYQALPTSVRQGAARGFAVKDSELLLMMKIMAAGRNACAHKDRVYCLAHRYWMPNLGKRHPKIQAAVTKGLGKNNLFAVLMSLKPAIGTTEMKPLANLIEHELNELSKKLSSIPVSVILDKIGFPANWHDVLTAD